MSEWQPIETAPTNDDCGQTRFLAVGADGFVTIAFVGWHEEGVPVYVHENYVSVRNLTHWMPIPAPPVQP